MNFYFLIDIGITDAVYFNDMKTYTHEVLPNPQEIYYDVLPVCLKNVSYLYTLKSFNFLFGDKIFLHFIPLFLMTELINK